MEKFSQEETIEQEELLHYENSKLSAKDRVPDLIGRMTLEGKVAQMLSVGGQKKSLLFERNGTLDLSNLRREFKNGMGQIARFSETGGGVNARQMAELANSLQKHFVEETRLGIPVIFHEECLRNHRD
jgi:beta-glucosidase